MMSKREFTARLLMVLGILGLPITSFVERVFYLLFIYPSPPPPSPPPSYTPPSQRLLRQLVERVFYLLFIYPSPPPPSPPPSSTSQSQGVTAKEFEFSYDPGGWSIYDIIVNKGDNVRVTIRGGDQSGARAFMIGPYAYASLYEDVVVIEFEASLKGLFKMYPTGCHCPYGGMEYMFTVV